jgi:hypothetical protein
MAHIQGQMNELREEERARIRQELKELRDVNRELQELRSQLAVLPPPVADTPQRLAGAATPEPATLDLPPVQTENVAAGSWVLAQPKDGNPDTAPAGPRPIAPEPPTAGSILPPVSEPEPDPRISKTPAANAPPPAVPGLPPSRPRAASAARPDPEELHAKLCLRMASLQSERRSRWQRILGMLSGAASER